MRIPVSLYGVYARIINLFTPVKHKHWVLGADYGDEFREGSKYMIKYMLQYHKDYSCTYITNSNVLYNQLNEKGIPCELNFTKEGIRKIVESEVVITCRTINDILFAYKKKGRKHYYLVHGQPLKLAFNALPESYRKETWQRKNVLSRVFDYLCGGITMEDSTFLSATSEFLLPFMDKEFGHKIPIKVLGMPRNDVLFDNQEMLQERWLGDIADKFVITYMPTHRKYGKGSVSPSPFINRSDIQDWMRDNGVVLLVKQHPNMIPKLKDMKQTDVIRDITCDRLDPQVCIYHSDVLITDFSSVWMDYLLLRRPILFYIYDNFEQDDAGCHYDIREDPPGHFCKTEDELFALIKRTKENYDSMRPSDHIVSKYHKYVDGNSCERYFNAIVNDID